MNVEGGRVNRLGFCSCGGANDINQFAVGCNSELRNLLGIKSQRRFGNTIARNFRPVK